MALPAIILTPTQPPQPPPPAPPITGVLTAPSAATTLSLKQPHKHPDPASPWTAAIARHCRAGNLSAAAHHFTLMRLSGVAPNHVTFVTLLSYCAHFPSQNPRFAFEIHGYVRKLGLDRKNVKVGTGVVDMYCKMGLLGFARASFDEILEKNSVSWNTMIDGYVRNGEIEDAIKVFDEMPQRDVISWTALIGGFVKKGLNEEALELFCEMQLSGIDPDYVTVIAVLSACANLGALNLGLWVNRFVMGKEFRGNVRVCNTLIDMYSRCGKIEFAREVFETMQNHTLVSWNSVICGFATNGLVDDALEFFQRMREKGFEPDGVGFTGVLTACSHGGFVDAGLKFFDEMQRNHRISPRIEHYGCLVDLYSRAGRLRDAFLVIKNMPMKPNEVVVSSLLAACRDSGDVSLAETLMNYVLELYPSCDSNYILLANMFAAAGSWEGSGKIRRKMKTYGIRKTPGISSIEIDDRIHGFVAGDKSHSETESIYAILELLSHEVGIYGCVPVTATSESQLWE